MRFALALVLMSACVLGPAPRLARTHHEFFRAAQPTDVAAIADKIRHEYNGRIIAIVSHDGAIWLLAEVPGS